MILIDPRKGSGELLRYFEAFDVPVDSTSQLPAADFVFFGNGQEGLVSIGIERKRITDLVDSMRSKRLSGFQLGRLGKEYDWVYLVVEGVYKCGEMGDLVEWRGNGWRSLKLTYREVSNYLTTLSHKAGTEAGNNLRVWRTNSPQETVAWIVGLYKWWQKGWEQHQSHEAIYDEYVPINEGHKGRFMRRTITLVEKVAAQLPGIDTMAYDLGRHFRSVEELVTATKEELARVSVTVRHASGIKETRKLGAKKGEKIWTVLRS